MKEKEIRERIERFLERTARKVVVPASVGLSLSGCGGQALHGGRADAGRDGTLSTSDASSIGDAAVQTDLPQIFPPYLVLILPDGGDLSPMFPADLLPPDHADAAPDVSASDAESEAGPRPDARADAKEAGRDVVTSVDLALDFPRPPPPYLILPEIEPGAVGGMAPLSPFPKKND